MSFDYEASERVMSDGRARAVQRAGRGEHLCSFHGTAEEQRRLASAFVAAGLGAGERVLYLANDHASREILGLLSTNGVDLQGSTRDGQLVVLDFAAVAGPITDASLERVVAACRGEAERSRADGFTGLRIAVEMGDLAAALGGLDGLDAWEQTVGRAFEERGITALCQYDARRHDPVAQARIAAVHGAVAADDGSAPTTVLRATTTPWGLEVAGELDLSTTEAFGAALRARAAVRPRVTVDLAAVTFADVATLRAVFTVARELPEDAQIVLARVPAQIVRVLALLGWRDPRVEVQPE